MGEAKYNPKHQLAKEGKLPPKPQKMSKRQQDALLYAMVRKATGMDKLEEAMFPKDTDLPYGRY